MRTVSVRSSMVFLRMARQAALVHCCHAPCPMHCMTFLACTCWHKYVVLCALIASYARNAANVKPAPHLVSVLDARRAVRRDREERGAAPIARPAALLQPPPQPAQQRWVGLRRRRCGRRGGGGGRGRAELRGAAARAGGARAGAGRQLHLGGHRSAAAQAGRLPRLLPCTAVQQCVSKACAQRRCLLLQSRGWYLAMGHVCERC